MSDDLIRRLRVTGRLANLTVGQEANEAADRIAALEAENAQLLSLLGAAVYWSDYMPAKGSEASYQRDIDAAIAFLDATRAALGDASAQQDSAALNTGDAI